MGEAGQGVVGALTRARVVERPKLSPIAQPAGAELAVAEPLVIHLPEDEPVTESFVEIIDVGSGHHVITVIEVLSLSNKLPGEGQRLYLKKQLELKPGAVSLVEIDLLRAGQHVLSVPSERIPEPHRTPYKICVGRSWGRGSYELYPAPLRETLPVIRVPLRETDNDVPLDLQALLEQAYMDGAYDDLDYTAEPNPPLDPADAAWTGALLREKGLR